jgi:hypothetical protein
MKRLNLSSVLKIPDPWHVYLVACGGVAIALHIGLIIRAIPTAEERKLAEVVDKNVAVADGQAAKELQTQLKPVREMFSRARRVGTRAFAEDALSWESKYKLTKDYVTGGCDHKRYLEQRFAARIFSDADIEKTVKTSVAAYFRQLDAIDSQLLVSLQADIASISHDEAPTIDRKALELSLERAIKDAVTAVAADTRGMIGQELASYIAGDVLAIAALELATSSGILTAGAASGTVTLGVGLVVGLIVDYLVSWAYDKYFDPTGELERQLDRKLVEMEQFILDGTSKSPGLEKRLQDYAARRGIARSVAIKAVVIP